jgi:hypothetical protein
MIPNYKNKYHVTREGEVYKNGQRVDRVEKFTHYRVVSINSTKMLVQRIVAELYMDDYDPMLPVTFKIKVDGKTHYDPEICIPAREEERSNCHIDNLIQKKWGELNDNHFEEMAFKNNKPGKHIYMLPGERERYRVTINGVYLGSFKQLHKAERCVKRELAKTAKKKPEPEVEFTPVFGFEHAYECNIYGGIRLIDGKTFIKLGRRDGRVQLRNKDGKLVRRDIALLIYNTFEEIKVKKVDRLAGLFHNELNNIDKHQFRYEQPTTR